MKKFGEFQPQKSKYKIRAKVSKTDIFALFRLCLNQAALLFVSENFSEEALFLRVVIVAERVGKGAEQLLLL